MEYRRLTIKEILQARHERLLAPNETRELYEQVKREEAEEAKAQ